MKKYLLFVFVFAFSIVNAQVTSTNLYQPWKKYGTANTQFTTGVTRTSSLIATGTFSAGSTATVTGGLKVTGASTIGLGQNNYLGSIVSSQLESTGNGYIGNKLRIGSNVAPTATLDVTGDAKVSSTFSLGSANLTGGNTGTVAVLSDAVFPITLNQGTGNPADGATFYLGNASAALVNNASYGRIRLPYNSTLVAWDLNWYAAPGSAESVTVSIAGTTTLAMSSTITFSAAAAIGNYTATGLSNNFNAGDLLNIKIECPTWVTNPTILHLGVTLWFVRRS